MNRPAGADHSLALREEVYRVWLATDRTRFLLRLAAGSGAAMLAALASTYFLVYLGLIPAMLLALAAMVLGICLFFVALGAFCGCSLAAAHRGLGRRRLWRRFARLPVAERRKVLLSLQADPIPRTEEIVDDLLRNLRLKETEVVAAPALEGDGAEVAPTPYGPAMGMRAPAARQELRPPATSPTPVHLERTGEGIACTQPWGPGA